MVRREVEGFAGSGSGAGLGSRAGALRFLEDAGARVDEAVAVVPTEAPDDSEELAACLADALVILPDMMVSIWLWKSALQKSRRSSVGFAK